MSYGFSRTRSGLRVSGCAADSSASAAGVSGTASCAPATAPSSDSNMAAARAFVVIEASPPGRFAPHTWQHYTTGPRRRM